MRRGSVSAVVAGAGRPVDLVLADPPYDVEATEVGAVVAALDRNGWTRSGTVVVVERPAASPPLPWPDDWEPWRERRYGDTRLEMAERG